MPEIETHDWVAIAQERDHYINLFKSGAQFFPAGRIIPTWILKISPKRISHHVTFGKDCWVRHHEKNIYLFCDIKHRYIQTLEDQGERWHVKVKPYRETYWSRSKNVKSLHMIGNPYGKAVIFMYPGDFESRVLYKHIDIFGLPELSETSHLRKKIGNMWYYQGQKVYDDAMEPIGRKLSDQPPNQNPNELRSASDEKREPEENHI